jgi:hypothetical protein
VLHPLKHTVSYRGVMQCKRCGAANHDGAQFCGGCGKPVVDPDRQRGERERLQRFIVGTFEHDHGVKLDQTALERIAELVAKAHVQRQTELLLPFVAAGPSGPLHLELRLEPKEFQKVLDGELEAPSDDDAEEDDEDEDDAEAREWRAKQAAASERRRIEDDARRDEIARAQTKKADEKREERAREKRESKVVVAAVVALLAAIGSFIFYKHEKAEHEKDAKSEQRHARTAGTTGATEPVLVDAPVLDASGVQVASFLVGTWRGNVHQRGTVNANYVVRVSYLPDGSNSVSYPTNRCGGHWTLVSASANEATFTEHIDYGAAECVPTGTVVVKSSNGGLSYQWSGNGDGVTGELHQL